jgi:type II secretory pathway pseudopilin PulG
MLVASIIVVTIICLVALYLLISYLRRVNKAEKLANRARLTSLRLEQIRVEQAQDHNVKARKDDDDRKRFVAELKEAERKKALQLKESEERNRLAAKKREDQKKSEQLKSKAIAEAEALEYRQEQARIEQALAQEAYELEAYKQEAFERDAYEQEAFKQLLFELAVTDAEVNSALEQVHIIKRVAEKPQPLIQRLLPSEEIQKIDWLEFKKLLAKHNIYRLYHFTDRENVASIRAAGGLISWYSCKQNAIAIARPGGSESSWQLDSYKGLADYVRLAFIPDHPMMYVAKKDGRLKSPIVLEIDPAVIFLQATKFSEMNAVKNGVVANGELDKFLEIRFNIFKKRYFDLTDEEKPYYQAEVLIHRMLPAKYILNLDRFAV